MEWRRRQGFPERKKNVEKIMVLLLASGAKLNAENNKGQTLLFWIVVKKVQEPELVELLESYSQT